MLICMIGQITGSVVFSDSSHIILDVQGVGYRLALTAPTLSSLSKDSSPLTFWTYLAVRENALDLYGFLEKGELDFFELMISVSGIGPKKALAILSLAPISVLRQAIVENNPSYLTKVSGVGRKNAEKIVLELHDKIGDLGGTEKDTREFRDDSDVLEAIRALGYSLAEARDALKRIPSNVTGVNARIKEALRQINK